MNIVIRTILGRLFSVVAYTYTAAIVVWMSAWFLFEGNHGLRVLFSHYGGWLLILVLPLILIALVARRRHELLALVLPLVFLLYLAFPYLRPVSATEYDSADISVMTFNVLFKNTNFGRIESHLTTYQPDLVALQEVNNELFSFLNERLGNQYPHSLKSDDPDYSATAILSRYPVEEFYTVDLGEIRPAVVARLLINGKRVKFISGHLYYYYGWWKYPPSEMLARITEVTDLQHEQVRRLLEEVERHDDDIVILGCDCNAPETSETRLMLEEALVNSAKATGWTLPQPNLPSIRPFYFPQHIDYIFHSGAVEPLSIYAINDSAGSDHLPILGRFRIKN